jgi:hypothetical protein
VALAGCPTTLLYNVSVRPAVWNKGGQRPTSAVILPRVQTHFNLSHEVVGLLSACTMAGVSSRFPSWPRADAR